MKGEYIMRCPDVLELQSFFDQELAPWRARLIQKHIKTCTCCHQTITEINQVVTLLKRNLAPETVSQPLLSAGNVWAKRVLPAVAALILLAMTIGGFWTFYQAKNRDSSIEAEAADQYLTLYTEDCN
jgi:hypothetical protein